MQDKIIYTEVLQKLAQAIKSMVQNELKYAKYDRTFKAIISKKISSVKYEINYQNRIYTATTSRECNVGDIVRVCAPQNNWNDLFIL